MRYSHGLLKDVPARVPLPNKNIQRGPYWGFLILITVAQTLAKFFGEKKVFVGVNATPTTGWCECHLKHLTGSTQAPHHPLLYTHAG